MNGNFKRKLESKVKEKPNSQRVTPTSQESNDDAGIFNALTGGKQNPLDVSGEDLNLRKDEAEEETFSQSEVQDMINEYEAKIKELSDALEEETNKSEQVPKLQSELNDIKTKGKAQVAKLKDQIEEITTVKDKLQEKIDNASNSTSELQDKLDQSEKEKSELKERLKKSNEGYLKLQSENEENSKLVENAKNSANEAKSRADKLQEQLNATNQHIQELEANANNSSNELEVKLSKVESELKISKDTIIDITSDKQTLEAKVISLKQAGESKDEEIRHYQSQINQLENDLNAEKSKHKELLSEIEQLKNENEKLHENNALFKNTNSDTNELNNKIKSLNDEISELQDDNDAIREENDNRNTTIVDLQDQIKDYEKQIKDLTKESEPKDTTDEQKKPGICLTYNDQDYTEDEIKEIIKRRGPKSDEEHTIIEMYQAMEADKGLDSLDVIPNKVFTFVCHKTLKTQVGVYSSEMYSRDYTDKLLNEYADEKTNSSNPLFKALIGEMLDKQVTDEYLGENLSKQVLHYIRDIKK